VILGIPLVFISACADNLAPGLRAGVTNLFSKGGEGSAGLPSGIRMHGPDLRLKVSQSDLINFHPAALVLAAILEPPFFGATKVTQKNDFKFALPLFLVLDSKYPSPPAHYDFNSQKKRQVGSEPRGPEKNLQGRA
jgi:hypothetical protein